MDETKLPIGRPVKWSRRWVLVAILLAGVVAAVMPSVRRGPGELPVYLEGSRRMLAGEPVYRAGEHKPFTYPPFFALPTLALVPLPERVQQSAWWFINLTMIGLGVALVTRIVWPVAAAGRARGGPPVWINAALVTLLSAKFLLSPLEYQSHDPIVFALVMLAAAALAAGRCTSAGAWAGLAAACKATPLLFLPVLAWQRRIGGAAALVTVLVAATFLPDALCPADDGRPWVVGWYEEFVANVDAAAPAEAGRAWDAWNPLNQSLSGTIYRLATPAPGQGQTDVCLLPLSNGGIKAITLAGQLAVLAFIAWATWLPRTREGESFESAECSFRALARASCVMCGMLLLSPMSSTQHFCLLYPAIAVAVTQWTYRRRSIGLATGLALIFLSGTLGAKDLVGSQIQDFAQALGGTTWCTVVCLILAGVSARSRSQVEAASDLAGGDHDLHGSGRPRRAA